MPVSYCVLGGPAYVESLIFSEFWSPVQSSLIYISFIAQTLCQPVVFSFLNNYTASFSFLCSQLATVIEAKAAKEAAHVHGTPTKLRVQALKNDCVPCRPDLVP